MVRFVGNGLHPSDFSRIEEWATRLKSWFENGLQEVYFFTHEPDNLLAPELTAFCVRNLRLHTCLKHIAKRPQTRDWATRRTLLVRLSIQKSGRNSKNAGFKNFCSFISQRYTPVMTKHLILIFACCAVIGCKETPTLPGTAANPPVYQKSELQKIRWIEGTWKSQVDGPGFYQTYTFPTDSTLEVISYQFDGKDTSSTTRNPGLLEKQPSFTLVRIENG